MYGFIVIPRSDLTPYDLQTLGMFLVCRLAICELSGTRVSQPTNLEGLLRGQRPQSPAASFHSTIPAPELEKPGFTKHSWRKYFLRRLGRHSMLRAVCFCADEADLEDPVLYFFEGYPRSLIRRIFAFELLDCPGAFDPRHSPAQGEAYTHFIRYPRAARRTTAQLNQPCK